VSGTKRALFHRTRAAISDGAAGGHTVRGGTMNPISSTKGKQEPKHTAGVALRAVAASHSSSRPMRDIALVTALYSESLW
jgi:hypothetical protein